MALTGRRAAISAAVAAAAIVGITWWRTERAVTTSQLQVQSELTIRFSVKAPQPSAAFEPILSAAAFLDAASYSGKVYVASSNALLEYIPETQVVSRTFRVGAELPPAPLTALASGPALGETGQRLYVGTAGEGLLIFDGSQFRQVLPEAANLRSISAMVSSGEAGLLLGTPGGGVFRFDGRALSWLHPSLRNLKVTALAGEMSDLWVGTRDKGAAHFHGGQVTETSGLRDSQILSVAVLEDSAWLGSATGTALVRGGKLEKTVAPGYFARAVGASKDTVWVGTIEEGVLSIPGSGKATRISLDSEVRRIVQLGQNWFAVARGGLYLLSNKAATPTLRPASALLTDGNISSLAFDSSGRLWVGYFDRGLDVVTRDMHLARHVENGTIFCVNQIVDEPGRQRTTVATANGLVYFDGALEVRQTLTKANGLIANHVTSVAPTAMGLVAGTPAGVTLLDPAGVRSLYVFHGLVNNHVYALEARGDRILTGTLGGLTVLERESVKANLTTANSGLKHNWITGIASFGDRHYIGSYGGGVVQLRESMTIESFPDMPKDVIVNPNALAATLTAVYAGTLGRGLGIFNYKTERWRFTTAGLPSANVTAFAAQSGYLYIGTENGLVRVPEKNLEF